MAALYLKELFLFFLFFWFLFFLFLFFFFCLLLFSIFNIFLLHVLFFPFLLLFFLSFLVLFLLFISIESRRSCRRQVAPVVQLRLLQPLLRSVVWASETCFITERLFDEANAFVYFTFIG